MNITKIITGIIITFMFFALWAPNASQTRNIDPRLASQMEASNAMAICMRSTTS
ncbi:hypothetical protein [Acinetobacter tandoii]|uniref:hypothetical protein n=1 Tax=Acinetobacter tandoii TaxID=202954 RepID=UPI00148F3C6B|nr:hypothetical protein [Acinetobacter tandoii]